jgi:hypothetical protein
MKANGGNLDVNHWSNWTEDISGGCYMPEMIEERRAWFAKHFPDYTWDTAVIATESLPEDVGARIVEALRERASRGL